MSAIHTSLRAVKANADTAPAVAPTPKCPANVWWVNVGLITAPWRLASALVDGWVRMPEMIEDRIGGQFWLVEPGKVSSVGYDGHVCVDPCG